MEPKFKVFDFSLPKVGLDEFLSKHVWPTICSGWTEKELNIVPFSIGCVNQLTLYHTADDVDVKSGVVVRVNATDMSQERYDELIYMQIAHHAECFSAVRAVFHNGLIYDYMHGEPYIGKHSSNPAIASGVMRSLARLHWIDTDQLSIWDRKGRLVQFSKEPNYMKTLLEVLHDDSYQLAESVREVVKFDELEKEVNFLKHYLNGLDLPTVNSHNDFHVFNIICEEKSGEINTVDYEMCGHRSPATMDLSFIACMGDISDESLAPFLDLNVFPPEKAFDDLKRIWLTAYLEEKHRIEGASDKNVGHDELELWFAMMQITDVVIHFERFIVLLRAFQCTTREDSLAFMIALYKRSAKLYEEGKEKLPSLREKYIDLKARANKRVI